MVSRFLSLWRTYKFLLRSSRIDGAPILLLAGEFARFTGRVTQTRANKRNDLHVPNAAFHWSW
ncbi:MAG: hypothetical protein DME40_08195 [Verrucomicrobia bacterium]|nr:MAG: hypothetical protein DME40_08195 [Verrucomicrobiota bacterium]